MGLGCAVEQQQVEPGLPLLWHPRIAVDEVSSLLPATWRSGPQGRGTRPSRRTCGSVGSTEAIHSRSGLGEGAAA